MQNSIGSSSTCHTYSPLLRMNQLYSYMPSALGFIAYEAASALSDPCQQFFNGELAVCELLDECLRKLVILNCVDREFARIASHRAGGTSFLMLKSLAWS